MKIAPATCKRRRATPQQGRQRGHGHGDGEHGVASAFKRHFIPGTRSLGLDWIHIGHFSAMAPAVVFFLVLGFFVFITPLRSLAASILLRTSCPTSQRSLAPDLLNAAVVRRMRSRDRLQQQQPDPRLGNSAAVGSWITHRVLHVLEGGIPSFCLVLQHLGWHPFEYISSPHFHIHRYCLAHQDRRSLEPRSVANCDSF